MNLKRTLTIILVLIMGVSLLSSCSKKDGEEKTSTSINETKDNEKEEKISFTYWHPIHAFTAKGMESHNEHPYAKRLEEETGVHVEYINPPVGQETEKLNLIFSSGDLPDAFHIDLTSFYRGGVDGAIEDGIVIENFTQLVEENAPNFMAWINSDEAIRKDTYTDEGNIRGFGAIIPADEMRGLPFQGPFLNKKLLDKTGLDLPETIADWEELLLAFQANGVEIPLTWPSTTQNPTSNNFDAFAGAYGVPSGADFYQEDGVVKFGPIQPGFKQYLELMSRWYEMGLLDADYISRDMNKHIKPLFIQDKVGAVVGHMTFFVQWPELAASENKELEICAAPYPVLNEGDTVHFRHHVPNIKEQATFITTAAENPVEIVKWIDYLYSPEGEELIVWGDEGETFEIDENGHKQYTNKIENNPDGIPFSYARRQLLFHDITPTWNWEEQEIFYDHENQHEGWELWSRADFDYMLPTTLILTVDESEEYSQIMSEVKTYFDEMVTKFIMGIEPLDKYDEFVSTIENMGIDKATQIKQDAYNRYLAR